MHDFILKLATTWIVNQIYVAVIENWISVFQPMFKLKDGSRVWLVKPSRKEPDVTERD